MNWLAKFLYLLRRLIPLVIRFIGFSITWMLKCMAAQFRGMPEAVDQLARDWTRNAIINSRIPLEFEKYIYGVMKVIAWSLIIFGYIVASHLVVFIFWRLF